MVAEKEHSAQIAIMTAIMIQALILLATFIEFSLLLPFVKNFSSRVGLFAVVLLVFVIVMAVWILLDYRVMYVGIRHGKMRQLETQAAIIGFLQLFLGGVIPGGIVLYVWGVIVEMNRGGKSREQHNPPL